jgi:hypothetical protein
MTTDLTPQYDSRASFYGKAHVETDDTGNFAGLISYTTLVAKINRKAGRAEVYGTYSSTTLRHIKEFLKQNGFKAESSKQIMADYGVQQSYWGRA